MKLLKLIGKNIIVWTFVVSIWSILRQFGQEVIDEPEFKNTSALIFTHGILGVVSGAFFGTFQYFYHKYFYKYRSFGKALLVGAFIYTILIIILIIIGITVFSFVLQSEVHFSNYSTFLLSHEMLLVIAYLIFAGFLIHFFQEIDKKFGPGNLWRMITGEFYSPREVERIFMFLDLKSSTALAEELGHNLYSQLIQDCFKDLSIVTSHEAEIYQYVGDEVVLTWDVTSGINQANCIRSFFSFNNTLNEKAFYYYNRYKTLPKFKCGLHVGKVMMAEVGEIKREIAYHGDAINTTARIQQLCNTYEQQMLISEDLKSKLESIADLSFEFVDSCILKGKSEAIRIFSCSTS